jgi:hypothetical protein
MYGNKFFRYKFFSLVSKFADKVKFLIMQEKKLEEIIKELPEDLRKELEDFAQFLWEKKFVRSSKQRKLSLTWVGGLKEYRDKFTSLDLQKKALEWWDDNNDRLLVVIDSRQ